MDVLKEYILQNWALILVLMAFIIMLLITVFLDRSTIKRMYILICSVFVLSIIVFLEFHLGEEGKYHELREWLVAIRYSATPIIIALIIYALVKRTHWYVLVPAFVLTIINIISIFTGIVFSLDNDGTLERGFLGYLPYIGVGAYSVALIYILYKQSNKQIAEILPIIFLAFALLTGLIFPLTIGKDYSKIFCTTIAIALFVYYVFLILQLTKKDALTGLLNRQAYYALLKNNAKDITAIISIDMNGLKVINDTEGHLAGDLAITTVANCFLDASKSRQSVFRLGGDEFIIVCKKTNEDELKRLVEEIKNKVSETKYSVSIGYCYNDSQNKNLEEMVKISDQMMYADKAEYYRLKGIKK
ncbi:MAG: GGDEF domain-containing protein [Acholeplasmatales bacterium]|nr:GGDEF domain-containing protein [Acholeplasmatales bacterium]